MKKIFITFLFIFSGCTQEFNDLTIDDVRKKDDHLLVSISLNDQKIIENINSLSSKKLVCNNLVNHEQIVEAYIEKIEKNKVIAGLEFCKNNDNRSCKTININKIKEINLKCQIILSAMLGEVYKSKKFPLVINE